MILLRRDPRDDPYFGTILAGYPAMYHLRFGDRRIRIDRIRQWYLRRVWWWSNVRQPGIFGFWGTWQKDLIILLGPIAVRTWRILRMSSDDVKRHVDDWIRADAEAWAESQGIILCEMCRVDRREECQYSDSPLCERMP